MKPDDKIFDAVLLDLDGGIVDSSKSVEKVWSRWAMENKIPWETVKNYVHGKRTIEIMQQSAPELDEAAAAKIIEDKQSKDINKYQRSLI